MSLFALCLFTGQSCGVWLTGRDAYGPPPVFVAAAPGLAVLGFGFSRRLKIQARSARA